MTLNDLLHKNYFDCFDLTPSHQIDLARLKKEHRLLQREVHPDRFINATETEQMLAVQVSAYLQEAYQTLSTPRRRAGYLLKLAQIELDEEQEKISDPHFLVEQLEWGDRISEASGDELALHSLEQELKAYADEMLHESFSKHWLEKNNEEAKQSYLKMRFIERLLNNLAMEQQKIEEQ